MSNDTSATNCWLSRWKTDTRWWAAWQWEKTRPDQTGPDGTRRYQSNWNDSFNRLLISLVAAGSRCSLVSSSFCFGLALGSWRTWTTIVVGRSWLLLTDFQWLSMIFNDFQWFSMNWMEMGPVEPIIRLTGERTESTESVHSWLAGQQRCCRQLISSCQ